MKNSSEETYDIVAIIGGKYNIAFGHRRTPFSTNAMHTHDYCELVVYTEGHKSVCVNDAVYVSGSWCAFTFRPGEAHCGIHKNGEYHERYVINFVPDVFDGLPGGRNLLRCFFDREAGEYNRIVMPEEESERCRALLDEIFTFDTAETPEAEGLILANFLTCLGLFNRFYKSDIRRQDDVMPGVLADMLRYINENLSAPLAVGGLSHRFGVSVATTERLFREVMLMTPKRYIFMRRIEAAKIQLMGGASVTEACYRAGFNDYSHFIADFRRETGVTPSKYRETAAKTTK